MLDALEEAEEVYFMAMAVNMEVRVQHPMMQAPCLPRRRRPAARMPEMIREHTQI
jgi:hypothetical protein